LQLYILQLLKLRSIPVANDDGRGANYQTPRYVDVLANDTGLDDGGITISIITAPVQGTAIVTADSILYTPAAGFSGIETFTYQVCDADGDCSNNATVTITVKPDGQLNHIPVAVNDTVTTIVNTPIAINVLANDQVNDVFGDLKIFTNPQSGTVFVNTDRSITYTPFNFFKGTDRFTYWVEDVDGDYDTASVSVNVIIKPNSIPVAKDDGRGANYQTPRYVDVLANDTGLDDGGITLSIITAPAQGTAVVTADSILYTPAVGFSGISTFEYSVMDKDGDGDTARVTITVLEDGVTNHIPVAVNDTVETTVNTIIDINVLANDIITDGFGDLLIYVYPKSGTAVVNANRTITYTPSNLFIGSDSFEYWVEDKHGDYDIATVSVTVIEKPNAVPVANDDARGTEYQSMVSVDVLTNDSGLDDKPVILTIESDPAQGSVNVNADRVEFTPSNGFSGFMTFQYRVTDNNGDWDVATVTINVKSEGQTNYIPVAVNDSVETLENIPIEINVLANDGGLEDGFGQIIIFKYTDFGSLTINPNRTITYQPSPWFIGTEEFVYWVEDLDGDYDTARVVVHVTKPGNHLPVAFDDARGTEYNTPVTVDVLTNDKGLEDGGIVVSVETSPAQGSVTIVNNEVVFTPESGFTGKETFSYRVTDKEGDFDIANVLITVKEDGVVNHIPVAVNDTSETIENTSVIINILANDAGLDDGFGKILIFTEPLFGSVIVNANRTITYTPANAYIGSDSLVYWIEDIDGDYDMASVLFNVVITPDSPVVVTISSLPLLAEGTAIVNVDNTITFTPATGFSGISIFRYTVTDKDGDSDDAQVTITVLGEGETNHIPVAVNDTVSTIFNTPIDINVLSNDTIEDAFGRLIIHRTPQYGTAVVTGRTVVYTPSNMFVGEDQFDYWVEDVHGDYSIATVVIEVTDKPDYQPVANDDARGCNFEESRVIDVLTNDTGLEDAPVVVTISSLPLVAEGTAIVNVDNTITFTPATGFSGISNFRYTVTDKDGDSDDAQVTITVLPEGVTNHIPVAIDDEVNTIENSSVDVNVLANDTNLDDGIQSVTIFKLPMHGNVTVNVDYTITYAPSPNFVGTDEFEYMVSDVHGDNDIAKVTVTVGPIMNSIPVANDDSRGTSLNTDVIVDVLSNDTGLEDGGIVVTITLNPSNGIVNVNADNTVTYTPNTGYMGIDNFEYQVCDINNDCDIANVKINVKEVNYIPIAVDDKYYTSINTSRVLNVLGNDLGLEDGGITVEILTQVMVGQVIVNEDNTITYNPLTGFEGLDYFMYKVTDIDGDYDIAIVTVNVTSGPLPGATITYSGNTNENGKAVQVAIVLNVAPLEDVSIDFSSEDQSEGTISVTRLTFTSLNWSTSQTISVTGVDDHIIDGNVNYRILANNMVSADPAYDKLNVENISLVNEDNDVANIILTISDNTTSEDEKNTEFTLELASEPSSDVAINITSSDVSEGLIDNENVVFTSANWNIPQRIIVTGVDDDLKDGDIDYEIMFGCTSNDNHYDLFTITDLQLTNIDNDGKHGLIIPEAFSPDNDGYNDKFEILGLEKYNKISIKIYNRWGNLIYSENNYQNNWDGKANATMAVGKELPTGTYFYIITIRDIDKEMSGYIFLKR